MPAPATAAAIERRDLVDGLGKGLRVIEAFDDDHPQLTASDTAARAGIKKVLLPQRNKKDVQDIPAETLEKLEIQYVETVGQALDAALCAAP